MSKFKVDDEFLYRYMPALEEKLFHAYPEEGELVHEFSEEFEKKMEKLINRARQKESYGIPVCTGKRIAAIIIAAMIGFLLASLHTKALPIEHILKKFYSYDEIVYEKATERRFTVPDEKSGEFKPMEPIYIPKGYELTDKDGDETFSYLCYKNPEGDSFFITQEQIIDGMVVSEDNEYVSEEEIIIHGFQGRISYKENGTIHIRWESDSTLYITAGNRLSKEELLKVCKSLN
ncbi:MAG: DUF4367 domain-containing protein [Lachnospiraceae bacterium]